MPKDQALTSITPLREGFRQLHRCVSSGYDLLDPESPRYDPDFPAPFKIGRHAFLVTAELEAYIQKKITTRAQQNVKTPGGA